MKRLFAILICFALLAIVVSLLLLQLDDAPRFSLSDGGSARVMGAAVGPYDLDSVKIGRWERIVARLPKPIREMVGWTTGGRSWGGSRSWFHVPNETNALQIYLRLDHSTLVASGSVANLKARIVDADGWVWESHGRGDRTVNPGASNRLDLIGLSFAGFPRWQSEFEVKLMLDGWSSGGRVLEEIAKFNLKNPVPATPTNLAARPLPQEIQAGPVQVVLNRLDYRPGWRSPEEVSAAEGERLGGLNPVFTSYERTGGGIVSNAWHEVMKDLEDNYGNNSHGALPVRRPGDTNAPPIQWRVGLHLVGDRHSEVASSAFYPLPAEPFPGGGQLATHSPSAARSRLNETVVEAVYLAGPGGIEFTNGVVATNFVADLPHGGVSHSTSSSTDGQGNHVASLRLESVTPMIVAGIKGPTDGLWFSCRVENLNTGKSFWLTQHGGPKDSHGFLRLYERNQLVWWSTEKLDTNVVWKIEVGVHRPQRFEFVVDRPEWVPKE